MKSSLFSNDLLMLAVAGLFVLGSLVAFLLQRGRQRSRFLAMRRGGDKPPPGPTSGATTPSNGLGIVRSSDLMRLTKDDERKHAMAVKLVEEGRIHEGALLFEELKLQRNAISALEGAGLIDEACAVLTRMNRPNRAGVIYHRNGMPVKAAEQFLIANLPEEAAKCYLEAGKDDAGSLRKAADIFEGLGRHDAALDAYARGDLMEPFVAFALKHAMFERLRDAMHDGRTTRSGFAVLDMYSAKKLVKHVPVDTQTAQSLALWCRTIKRVELIELALRKLEGDKNLLSLFWSLLPEDFSMQIVSSLLSAPQFRAPEVKPFLIRNARALFDAKRIVHAGLLYESTGRLLMAAKCQAMVGDLGYALDLLSLEEGDRVLARQLASLLTPHSEAPRTRHAKFPPEVVTAGVRIFQGVDPDGDELHTASPFTLTA